MQRHDKEYVHGQLAVEAARLQGIFPNIDSIWKGDSEEENTVKIADEDVDITINNWQTQLKQSSLITDEINLKSNDRSENMDARVLPISELWNSSNNKSIFDEMGSSTVTDVDNLNDDQKCEVIRTMT
jgi:hypothetical protein